MAQRHRASLQSSSGLRCTARRGSRRRGAPPGAFAPALVARRALARRGPERARSGDRGLTRCAHAHGRCSDFMLVHMPEDRMAVAFEGSPCTCKPLGGCACTSGGVPAALSQHVCSLHHRCARSLVSVTLAGFGQRSRVRRRRGGRGVLSAGWRLLVTVPQRTGRFHRGHRGMGAGRQGRAARLATRLQPPTPPSRSAYAHSRRWAATCCAPWHV